MCSQTPSSSITNDATVRCLCLSRTTLPTRRHARLPMELLPHGSPSPLTGTTLSGTLFAGLYLHTQHLATLRLCTQSLWQPDVPRHLRFCMRGRGLRYQSSSFTEFQISTPGSRSSPPADSSALRHRQHPRSRPCATIPSTLLPLAHVKRTSSTGQDGTRGPSAHL